MNTKTFLGMLLGVSVGWLIAGSAMADELDRKIGQMLMVGFRGFEIEPENPIVEDIIERNVGGVILFDVDVPAGRVPRNIESPHQVASLNASLQDLAEIPLLIAVDQEGGRIRRLKESHGFGPTVSHEEMGERNDLVFTREKSGDLAEMVRSAQFNFNLAPVVDLNVNPESPAIGALERSFSRNPDEVVRHAFEYIAAHRNRGVLTALKHFPGHGSAEGDTHLGFVDITETWTPSELIPYQQLIKAGVVDVVMTAHVFHADLDSEYPATLSTHIIGGILRDQLGFEGVVISDDMQMGAIAQHYSLETALERSINAGVDLLVFANNSVFEPDIAARAIGIIRKLVNDGRVPESRIHESYARIQELKAKMGLRPFERWQAEHFSEAELGDPAVSGEDAAPIGDGVSNLEKYFRGLAPYVFLSADFRPHLVEEENQPQLYFQRWLPATDLVFSVETSADLRAWNPGAGEFTPTLKTGEIEHVKFLETDGDNVRFYRLRLEREIK